MVHQSFPMLGITLRVLDGADRGKVYDKVTTPVTIGREEGNTIQLNDERISRFHIKIQEDNDKLVLTDLESTNGTKVNGEDIQLRILRIGDMISLGRSTLLLGTRTEIAERLEKLQPGLVLGNGSDKIDGSSDHLLDIGNQLKSDPQLQAALQDIELPQLPVDLKPGQAAQLSEMVEYFHLRTRKIIASVDMDKNATQVNLDSRQWQYLLDMQASLAEYLSKIGRPD